tara:strand:+ start:223 stop:504 length:282 start_codon:yes stop_codon:yes gene_type:complete
MENKSIFKELDKLDDLANKKKTKEARKKLEEIKFNANILSLKNKLREYDEIISDLKEGPQLIEEGAPPGVITTSTKIARNKLKAIKTAANNIN